MSLLAILTVLCVAVVGTCRGTLDRCEMPVAIGEKCSRNRLPGLRWFYDPSTDKCSKFIYYGCGGNQNKFLSQKRCQKVCSASCYDEMRKLWIANGLKKPSLCGECVCNSGVWACPSYSTCTLRQQCDAIFCPDECPSGLYYTDEKNCDTCNCVDLNDI